MKTPPPIPHPTPPPNCSQPVAYKEAIERFKYNQDLASKIWIAVASALLVLYFGKDIKRG